MVCPSCKVQLRIGRSYTTVEDGNAVTVQEMVCRNPQCPYHKANAPVQRIRHVHKEPAKDAEADAVKMHCDHTLARIDAKTFFVPPELDSGVTGDVLSVKCPVCGEWQWYDVTGRTRME